MQFKQATICFLLAFIPLTIFSQDALSPFFHMQSEASPGSLPLLENKARAIINGPVADVRITQVYPARLP